MKNTLTQAEKNEYDAAGRQSDHGNKKFPLSKQKHSFVSFFRNYLFFIAAPLSMIFRYCTRFPRPRQAACDSKKLLTFFDSYSNIKK